MEERGVLSPSYAMLLRTYLKAGLRPSEGRALQLDRQRSGASGERFGFR